MIALLYAHPRAYEDVGVVSWTQPRAESRRYLRRPVEAGYGTRVTFGPDRMAYPDAPRAATENVGSADLLAPAQGRNIFCHDAARSRRPPPSDTRPAGRR